RKAVCRITRCLPAIPGSLEFAIAPNSVNSSRISNRGGTGSCASSGNHVLPEVESKKTGELPVKSCRPRSLSRSSLLLCRRPGCDAAIEQGGGDISILVHHHLRFRAGRNSRIPWIAAPSNETNAVNGQLAGPAGSAKKSSQPAHFTFLM